MRSGTGVASLVPTGLVVDGVVQGEDAIVVAAHGAAATAACPLCGTVSERVHSRYIRQAADLPWAGRCVRLRLVVRRFLCDLPGRVASSRNVTQRSRVAFPAGRAA